MLHFNPSIQGYRQSQEDPLTVGYSNLQEALNLSISSNDKSQSSTQNIGEKSNLFSSEESSNLFTSEELKIPFHVTEDWFSENPITNKFKTYDVVNIKNKMSYKKKGIKANLKWQEADHAKVHAFINLAKQQKQSLFYKTSFVKWIKAVDPKFVEKEGEERLLRHLSVCKRNPKYGPTCADLLKKIINSKDDN